MAAAAVDLRARSPAHGSASHDKHPVGTVNDHAVRPSLMTEPSFRHRHPNCNEVFVVMEGEVELALNDWTSVLNAGRLAAVPSGAAPRTRARTARSGRLRIGRATGAIERVAR